MVIKSRRFTVHLTDGKKELALSYRLNDTEIARKWYQKIKHLNRIPIDAIESLVADVSDLTTIYRQFCSFAGITPISVDRNPSQHQLNLLHQVFETEHDRLSKLPNNGIVYKFHHAIHKQEKSNQLPRTRVGWGVKEGPLTETMHCNNYYQEHIKRNNIYLPWAELGKTPYQYWCDGEPNRIDRIIELCKPHVTFRAMFFLAHKDQPIIPFPNKFNQWFNQHKSSWCAAHSISDWEEKDEQSAPLLAIAEHDEDISGLAYVKIKL